jgi:hypothetical protein
MLLQLTPTYEELLRELQGKRDSIEESFFFTYAMVNREWTQEEYDQRHVMTRFAIHGFHHRICSRKPSTRPTRIAYVFCAVGSAIFSMLWSVRGEHFL